MLVFTPAWVAHPTGKRTKTPIYSLDVRPDGERLATAGLASIKVWNMTPIRNQEAEKDPAVPKLMASFSVHDGAILCVRWSPDNRLLASGSEDAKIVIWKPDASLYRNSVFDGSGSGSHTKNIETYRAFRVLPGHTSDVADLAWSSDMSYLASCGFDRAIVIWDGTTFECVKRIDHHAGFVKGITWDPSGKYLASQSDDRSVKIFRVSDWGVEAVITDPLKSGTSSSFFTRLSWSPDGATIAATNGESGAVCVAPLIQRQGWKSESFLVGHKAAVEVAKFNPRLFESIETAENGNTTGGTSASNTSGVTSICATGSQDNGIAIWRSSNPRAIASLVQVVEHSVLDLAWTSGGFGLVGCSYDGSVVYIEFTSEELGRALSTTEMDTVLSRFGKRGAQHAVPETANQLELEAALVDTDRAALSATGRAAMLMSGGETGFSISHADSAANAVAAAAVNAVNAATAMATAIAATSLSSSSVQGAPVPNESAAAAAAAALTPMDTSSTSAHNPSVPVVAVPAMITRQVVTHTRDGRRRIQPTFLQRSDDDVTMAPGQDAATHSLPLPLQPAAISSSIPVTSSMMMSQTSARLGVSNVIPVTGIPAVSGMRSGGMAMSTDTDVVSDRVIAAKYVLPVVHRIDIVPRLGVPAPRPIIVAEYTDSVSGQSIVVECRNQPNETRVVCVQGQEQHWTTVIPSVSILSCIGDTFVAVACADATLHVFSHAGRRIVPRIALASAVSFLTCSQRHLLCIDATGHVFVWDVVMQQRVVANVPVTPILRVHKLEGSDGGPSDSQGDDEEDNDEEDGDVQANGTKQTRRGRKRGGGGDTVVTSSQRTDTGKNDGGNADARSLANNSGGNDNDRSGSDTDNSGSDDDDEDDDDDDMAVIVNVSVRDDGAPIVSTSQGRSFVFHLGMETWMEVMDTSVRGRYGGTMPRFLTLDAIDEVLASVAIVGTATEYRHWLRQYARKIADEGALAKARELCNDLGGGSAGDPNTRMPDIHGVPRRSLLKDILPILAQNRKLQRVVSCALASTTTTAMVADVGMNDHAETSTRQVSVSGMVGMQMDESAPMEEETI